MVEDRLRGVGYLQADSGGRSDMQIRRQKQVDDVKGVIVPIHNDGIGATCGRDKVGVVDPSPVDPRR